MSNSSHYVRIKDLPQLQWLCRSEEDTRTIILKIRQNVKSTKEIAYHPRRNGRNWYLCEYDSARYYTENQLRTQTNVVRAIKQGNAFLEVGAYEDYWPVCPSCGQTGMSVVQLAFASRGDHMPLAVCIPLHTDGFESYGLGIALWHDEKADYSTQDEVVACDSCGKHFDLSEMQLEHEPENRTEERVIATPHTDGKAEHNANQWVIAGMQACLPHTCPLPFTDVVSAQFIKHNVVRAQVRLFDGLAGTLQVSRRSYGASSGWCIEWVELSGGAIHWNDPCWKRDASLRQEEQR